MYISIKVKTGLNEESTVFMYISVKVKTGLIPNFFFENIKMITIYITFKFKLC